VAAPVFLSYAWNDMSEVDTLDTMLRLRGVPVWRDRRNMRWGGYNEALVRRVLRDEASGFALYLAEDALDSDFITGIELDEADKRAASDPTFFHGGVFRGYEVRAGIEAVHQATGIDIGSTLGSRIEERDFLTGLRDAANAISRAYLRKEWISGPACFRIETRDPLPVDDPSLVQLSLAPPLSHDPDEYDVLIWDEQILPALDDLQQSLHTVQSERPDCDRVIQVGGGLHLSVALAVGYAFRQPTRWQVRMLHEGATWETRRERGELAGWQVSSRPGSGADGDLVVMIHASADVSNAVRASAGGLARAELQFKPPDGGNRFAIDPRVANGVAAGIAEAIREARNQYKPKETRLYMASPWPFAVMLGWHLASSGAVVMHEATVERDAYRVSCVLR